MENYAFDAFRFDVAQKQLQHNSQIISLQPKVAEMLAVFLEKHGELISREDLMQAVWKDTFVEETNLRFCIHSLRKVLGKNSGGKDYIETVPRRGYRFIGEIEEDDAENKIGRYKILQKIGVGGMGEVFLADDPQLERKVALKILLPQVADDDERIRRFKIEAKAVSSLNHPNIVTIFDIGEAKGKLFIAYEFIEGETLREKIRRNQLTVSDSINIAEQVANALAVAHKANIVHRDIKPENIMIRDDGYVKILDFGLAKRSAFSTVNDEETVEWVKTQKGIILGSVQYMSPEQSRGVEIDERTDIWSLGVVLYEMLTGKNPFEGETISDSVASILHFEPKSIGKYLQEFPAELRGIIEKALQKDLLHRYQDIKSFADDLKNVRRRLASDILTKRIIIDNSQEKTVELKQARITDEKNTLFQSDELPSEVTDFLGEAKPKKWRKRWLLVPLTALFASIILFYSYNFLHPFIFPNYYAGFKNPRVTRLTNDGVTSRAAISDDKKWVAFVRKTNGKENLLVRELATGNERIIEANSSEEILQPTFAPLQKYLLGARDFDDLYFVKKGKDSGTLYRSDFKKDDHKRGFSILPNVDSRISFSPDGNKFAFIRLDEKNKTSSIIVSPTNLYNEKVEITEKLSSKATKLTKFENVAWQSRGEEFSISGTTQYGDKGGSGDMYETSDIGWRHINGSANQVEWVKNDCRFFLGGYLNFDTPLFYNGYTEISSEAAHLMSFDSTPDAKAVVISTESKYPGFWVFDLETKENRQILSEDFGLEYLPSLKQTPDGKMLFTKRKLADPEKINIINRDVNKDYVKEQFQITSINSDGTNEVAIFQCEVGCESPTATPDGKYILFRVPKFGGASEKQVGTWRINADGSNPLQLTNSFDYGFELTPDGKTLIFSRSEANDKKLMKVSVDGGDVGELTDSSKRVLLAHDGKPSVFITEDKTGAKLMKISPDGEQSSVLVTGIKPDEKLFNAQIIGNGKYVLYQVSQFDKETSKRSSQLKVIPLNEGESNKSIWESDFDGYDFRVSPDEKWIYYKKEEAFFRLPLKLDLPNPQPELVLQIPNGKISKFTNISDFTWSKDNKLLYLLESRKSDVFLIEDVE